MAYSLYKTGELDEAVSELQKEIKKDPTDIESSLYLLTHIYFQSEDKELDNVIQILHQALERFPKQEEVYKSLISVYNSKHQYRQTNKIIQLARKRNVGNSDHIVWRIHVPTLVVYKFLFIDNKLLGAVFYIFSLLAPFLPFSISLSYGLLFSHLFISLIYQFLWLTSQNNPGAGLD